MEARWKAVQIKKASVAVFSVILVLTGFLYLSVWCGRDWVVIAGLAVDAVGAVLIAAPDLGFYTSFTYSGDLRRAADRIAKRDSGYISENESWYPVFFEEMENIIGTTNIPSDADFEIKKVLNSNLLFYYPGPDKDGKPINLDNVVGPLRLTIDEEEKLVRRYGAYLFVAGIVLQILGLLVSRIVFPSVFC